MKNEDYEKLSKVGLSLEESKYCDLGSFDSCVIDVKIGKEYLPFIINKYQQHYGSVMWDSIFSKIPYGEQRKVIVNAIFKQYPKILINEDLFIDAHKKLQKESSSSSYYEETYTQNVKKIVGYCGWVELKEKLSIGENNEK